MLEQNSFEEIKRNLRIVLKYKEVIKIYIRKYIGSKLQANPLAFYLVAKL